MVGAEKNSISDQDAPRSSDAHRLRVILLDSRGHDGFSYLGKGWSSQTIRRRRVQQAAFLCYPPRWYSIPWGGGGCQWLKRSTSPENRRCVKFSRIILIIPGENGRQLHRLSWSILFALALPQLLQFSRFERCKRSMTSGHFIPPCRCVCLTTVSVSQGMSIAWMELTVDGTRTCIFVFVKGNGRRRVVLKLGAIGPGGFWGMESLFGYPRTNRSEDHTWRIR